MPLWTHIPALTSVVVNTCVKLCSLFVDTLICGVWIKLVNLQDPELCRLAKLLPSTVIGGRADSTVAKYGYAFQRWKAWAEHRMGVPIFPLGAVHLALYLQHLGESIHSLSAV